MITAGRLRLVTGCTIASLLLAGAMTTRPAAPRSHGTDDSVVADWQSVTVEDGLPHESVRALCAFGGRLWIGTDGGLAMREGDRMRTWTVRDGLPWPAISAIAVDPSTHDVWLGTWGGGLVRFSAGRFDRFDQLNSGLAGDLVFAVKVIGRRVWVATNSGLGVFDWVAKTWDLHCERRADAPETIVSAIGAAGGATYASAWCEGLLWIDDSESGSERRVAFGAASRPAAGGSEESGPPFPGSETTVTLSVARNGLWLSTQKDLWRHAEGGAWMSRRLPVTSPAAAGNLVVSEAGEAWLPTERGLLCLSDWDTDTWLHYDLVGHASSGGIGVSRMVGGRDAGSCRLPASLRAGRVRCVAVLDGAVWAGTEHGLLVGRTRRSWHDVTSPEPDGGPASRPGSSRAPRSPGSGTETPGAVAVGLLGPVTRTVVLPGSQPAATSPGRADPVAAQIAFAHGLRNRPTSDAPSAGLFTGTSALFPYAWTSPEDEFIEIARKRDLLAMIGLIGPGKRAMSAVVAAEEMPFLNTSLAPQTSDELANPWVFRCRINDPRAHAKGLDYALDVLHCRKPAIVRTREAVASMYLDWWKEHATARGFPPVAELEAPPDGPDASAWGDALRSADFDVLLTWADEETSIRIVRELRTRGLHQPVVGSDRIVTDAFLSRLSMEPGTIVAPQPCPHRMDTAGRERFLAEYAPRRQVPGGPPGPPPMAWVSYDAVRHVMDAIDQGGGSRESLYRVLHGMKEARVARVEGGRWRIVVPAPR